MKRLNEYIYEELQINEGLLLLALCGAALTHFTIRGMKSVRKHAGNFWGWALGERTFGTQAAESLENNEQILDEAKEKFDKTKVQPMQVPDNKVLEQLMELLKGDAKKKSGFYVFDKLFQETPELKILNKAPYFANYVVFMDAGSAYNEDEKPNFYGMLGFSIKYWKYVAAKGKDEKIKEAAKELTNYINIFAVQTDKQYAKQGLFEVYIEDMKKAVKEAKMDGLTIKCDNKDLMEVFQKYGFKPIDNLDNYLALEIK